MGSQIGRVLIETCSVTVPTVRPPVNKSSVSYVALSGWCGVLLLLIATPVSATLFCDIKKTPNRFVALRAQPDRAARLVAWMTFGDEVLISAGIAPRNGWTYVTWWKGGRFKAIHPDGGYDKPDGKGWVYSNLVEDVCG
jgi:hypothetical protein